MSVGITWDTIQQMFLESTGDTAAAQREKWIHLSEGYRRVASQLDVPELTQPDARVTIPADPAVSGEFLDYVDVDCDLSAIRSIFNVTDGHPVHLEDGDARGRDRYLQTDAKPPEGQVVRALRMGNRLYVRDRPTESVTLKIIFKVQTPNLSDADLSDHPLLPAQYHLAILHKSLESYWSIHPDKNEAGLRSFAPAREAGSQAQALLATTDDPKGYEDRAKRGRFRLGGLRFSGRRMP